MRPVLVVVAAFALIAVLLGWSRWLAGRRWAAAGHLLLACMASAVVALGWPMTAYLGTYETQVAGRPVAELFFERIGSSRFRATLTRLPSGQMQVVELVGDQWRLTLATLDWAQWATPLGLVPRYRIERLGSRLAQPDESGAPVGVMHDLAGSAAATPRVAGLGTAWGAPLVAMRDAAGPWLPMSHGARFDVRLTGGDVVEVEPRNAAASESLAAP